jgi:hypothetical protein
LKGDGKAAFTVNVAVTTLARLRLASRLHKTKTLDGVVEEALGSYLVQQLAAVAKLSQLAKAYWPKIRPILPYLTRLRHPGETIRVREVVYTFEQAEKLAPVYSFMVAELKKLGVSDPLASLDELASANLSDTER